MMGNLRQSIGMGTFLWLACASGAMAHPVPAAQATLRLSPQGTYELRLRCDVSALVMQSTPGHLGDAATIQLQAMSDEELTARVKDARGALEYYLILSFDQQRTTPETITFPSLAVIRNAAPHGEGVTWPEIVWRGKWNPAAKFCSIQFPEALGKVHFKLLTRGNEIRSRQLKTGAVSGAIDLTKTKPTPARDQRSDVIVGGMAGLLFLYVCWLFWRRQPPRALPR